jgi:radical SAM protein with 4Fe4S-binding SPASM domain
MEKVQKNGNVVLYSASNAIRKIQNFFLVLNPEAPNLMVVDELGKKILNLSDGNHTRNQIVEILRKEFDCDKQNVEGFIDSLVLAKFIGEQSVPIYRRVKEHPTNLGMLQLHLTQACNLKCKHCYFSSGTQLRDELPDGEFVNLIREAGKMGIECINMTGGEPFLKKKLLFEIVREATSQGIEKVSANTNGTLLTEEDAFLLKKYNVTAAVSLDGATAETHDYIRGKGVFEKAVKAIKLLQETGVATMITMTLMKANIKETEEMVQLAKELGVSRVLFNAVRLKGRAEENIDDIEIPAKDVMPGLIQAWRTSRKMGIATTMESMWASVKKLHYRNLCGAGRAALSIAPNGDVYPCDAFYGEKAFKAGNIREKPLIRIWRDSPATNAFMNFTVNDIEECRDCELKYVCGGGCIGENYKTHGVLNKCSPLCKVFKEAYWRMINELAKDMWREAE